MNFYIKKITLWFRNNSEPQILEFQPNKINVITGQKSRGKSSIISIIDYCLLSSKSRIVEEVINENVAWYGLDFSINEKSYLIIRKRPEGHIVSNEIYFSSTGEVPSEMKGNIDIKKLKSIIETEFGIDETSVFPYGGKKLKVGSKISFRYFLLFNTQSEDTIANADTFFDYSLYDREKYVEALDRIFFLAIGVDDIKNVLLKERLAYYEDELDKIDKKKKAVQKQERLFNENIIQLISRAQEFDLIERKLFTHDEAYEILKRLVLEYTGPVYSNNLQQVDELNREKRVLWRKLRNLERFNAEYETYKKNLTADSDSLQPIEFLNDNYSELIDIPEVKHFLRSLKESLTKIKTEISKKKSIDINARNEIKEIKAQLLTIDRKLSRLPTASKEFVDEAGKFVFIGELKAQLKFYEDKWNILEDLPDENVIHESISYITRQLENTSELKKNVLAVLEERIQSYYDLTHSMGVYQDYKVYFDVQKKQLRIRKPGDLVSRQTIGSKSNHLFLHLCLFLGLHHHFISFCKRYVPQFIVFDQPSQPYLEKQSLNPETGLIEGDDDRATIKDAFQLLNSFIDRVNSEYKSEFQIILLEHASKDYWENVSSLNHFHLVEEFRDDNALIPTRAMKID